MHVLKYARDACMEYYSVTSRDVKLLGRPAESGVKDIRGVRGKPCPTSRQLSSRRVVLSLSFRGFFASPPPVRALACDDDIVSGIGRGPDNRYSRAARVRQDVLAGHTFCLGRVAGLG